MNIRKSLPAVLLLACSMAFISAAPVRAADAAPPKVDQGTQYSEQGADTCLMCHTEAWPYPLFPIFKTKHANRADKRTPFAGHFSGSTRRWQRTARCVTHRMGRTGRYY